MKVVIIDDEYSGRIVLKTLIETQNSGVRVVATCSSLRHGVEAIKMYKPEIVFVDLEMPVQEGFEIVRFFDRIDFKIVLVSASKRKAEKYSQRMSVEYLLKPFEIIKLSKTLSSYS